MSLNWSLPWAARAAPAPAPVPVPCLGLSAPVGARPAEAIVGAVLRRVGGAAGGVATVVLDMGEATEVSPADCAALLALHRRLASAGTRLRLAGAGPAAWHCLQAGGVVEALGPAAGHPTLRSAVLAACADQPGPALCTAQVRALLAAPAEPLLA